MKKTNLTVMLLLGMGITTAQAQRAVLSSGGDASGSGGSVSYSIGQIAYSYQSGSTGSLNQGVQQPYEFFSVGVDENSDISLSMTAFPNPTNATLSLSIENQPLDHLYYQLYDVSGKQILNRGISSSLTAVPMENLAPGSYFLKILNSKNLLKTFTIIKNL